MSPPLLENSEPFRRLEHISDDIEIIAKAMRDEDSPIARAVERMGVRMNDVLLDLARIAIVDSAEVPS